MLVEKFRSSSSRGKAQRRGGGKGIRRGGIGKLKEETGAAPTSAMIVRLKILFRLLSKITFSLARRKGGRKLSLRELSRVISRACKTAFIQSEGTIAKVGELSRDYEVR